MSTHVDNLKAKLHEKLDQSLKDIQLKPKEIKDASVDLTPFDSAHEVSSGDWGNDTRTNFVIHLRNEQQVKVVIDEDLPKGQSIGPSLSKAIESSHVSIVVFSQDYASSEWCLGDADLIKHIVKYVLQIKNYP
ncbi:protein PHLOEM PROTEIN 2-LIKE A8-like [Arachis ipaensis]|uniref:protein PHLOEM PROTEIN 2-LIKE A8-like n=1 Tax=Arachis ipaensis TaxID=130454 RepID=UPI000A2B1151|nr:protein PHLOEM PROTEIN 2-LIKE A8-like [Arachis ipaensis]